MGTNYYLVRNQEPKCSHCGHQSPQERLHIGKKSFGWVFQVHVHPERGIRYFSDWDELFDDTNWNLWWIEDEYGTKISVEKMIAIVHGGTTPEEMLEARKLKHSTVDGVRVLSSDSFCDYVVDDGTYW